jgi:Leucine-rich repeat (LRR) protein
MISLVMLQLDHNNLEGNIPNEICELKFLRRVVLSYNKLSGTIPKNIQKLAELREFSVENNMLDGEIPVRLFSLDNLTTLNLKRNKFTGSLPLLDILNMNMVQKKNFLTFNFSRVNKIFYIIYIT